MAGQWSRTPVLCDALVALFTAAAPTAVAALPANSDGSAAQLAVFDGPPVGDLPANYVAVGYSGAFATQAFTGSSGLAVESALNLSTIGNRTFYEDLRINCECSTYSGDADPSSMSRQRARTGAVFSAMVGAIQADATLGGLVAPGPAYAAVTTFRWLQDQTASGAVVTIQFVVAVIGEAWLPI
jgi:hypothetical protein